MTTHERDVISFKLIGLLYALGVIKLDTFLTFDLYGFLEIKQQLNAMRQNLNQTNSHLDNMIKNTRAMKDMMSGGEPK